MFWFGLAVLVSLAISIYFFWEGEGFFSCVGCFIFGCLFGGMIALIPNFMLGVATDGKTMSYTSSLKNIEQVSSTSGRFFLGSGYFGSEPSYYYYRNTGEDRYRLEHVDSDDAEIVEIDTTQTPHLEVIYKHSQSNVGRFWSVFPENYNEDFRYVFYVPKGSVSNSFNLGPQGE